MQKIFGALVLMAISTTLLHPTISLAEGEKRTFRVTGYYSPEPNQSFYAKGSYEADIRLNGNGTHGASGQPVFVGMLAAPKSYPFGTKIELEGLGMGIVTDRGGAIVKAGERGQSYDRIDVWMGKGEEGLRKALSWGIRTVNGVVYPLESAVSGALALSSVPTVEKKVVEVKKEYTQNLGKGSVGKEVEKVQEALSRLGYAVKTTGIYDQKTIEAVFAFQQKEGIVKNSTEQGAGYFGTRTRTLFEERVRTHKPLPIEKVSTPVVTTPVKEVPSAPKIAKAAKKTSKVLIDTEYDPSIFEGSTLSYGATGERVRILEQRLKEKGLYHGPITGIYGKELASAVSTYQTKAGILTSSTEKGSGITGPKTLAHLHTPQVRTETQRVEQLQNGLRQLGYFSGPTTGVMGPITKEALTNLQLHYALIPTKDHPAAGHIGPKTEKVLQSLAIL